MLQTGDSIGMEVAVLLGGDTKCAPLMVSLDPAKRGQVKNRSVLDVEPPEGWTGIPFHDFFLPAHLISEGANVPTHRRWAQADIRSKLGGLGPLESG